MSYIFHSNLCSLGSRRSRQKADFLRRMLPYGAGASCRTDCTCLRYPPSLGHTQSKHATGLIWWSTSHTCKTSPDFSSSQHQPSSSPSPTPASKSPHFCFLWWIQRQYWQIPDYWSDIMCWGLQFSSVIIQQEDPGWDFCSFGNTLVITSPDLGLGKAAAWWHPDCVSPSPLRWCWHTLCQGHGAKWSCLISISWLKKDKT